MKGNNDFCCLQHWLHMIASELEIRRLIGYLDDYLRPFDWPVAIGNWWQRLALFTSPLMAKTSGSRRYRFCAGDFPLLLSASSNAINTIFTRLHYYSPSTSTKWQETIRNGIQRRRFGHEPDLYAFIGFIGFIRPDDINYMCWTLSDIMCYILVIKY